MITFNQVAIRRGKNILLSDVNWTIYHRQKVGLIGANGTGKSSLMSVILQELPLESGEVAIPRQLRIAHVAQETPGLETSALDFVLDGDQKLRQLEKKLADAESEHDGYRIASLHEDMAVHDAYSAPARAAQLLSGLGFAEADGSKKVKEFSGGYRVRLNLAQALMCPSDVLLLDEPTNHLDLDAILWLENWLHKYPGTIVLISHDRDYLDKVVDHIAHLSQGKLSLYPGNYSDFERQRAAQLVLQQSIYEKQQRQLAHLQQFIDRFRAKATKARQVQSRVKAMERMNLVSALAAESEFQFHFREPKSLPNPLLTLSRATISYGENIILRNINLSIHPGDRIGILGPNGAGKSSLIKLLSGQLTAEGERVVGSDTRIGYFAQHQVDHLDIEATPLLSLQRIAPNKADVELRTFLGSFGFKQDRVLEKIQNFSGGEKSRLALALLIWQRPNLLLLDEPTNHLDLEMRNALSLALQEYQGAIIMVSHDRYLLRSTVNQLYLAANHVFDEFDGDVGDYESWLANYHKELPSSSSKPAKLSKKDERKLAADRRNKKSATLSKIQALEKEMEVFEKQLAEIENALLEQGLYEAEHKDKLLTLLQKQQQIKKSLSQLENEWLSTCESRDSHEH